MKALKRYTIRIIIPVTAAGFIAVTANMIYRAVTADETTDGEVEEVASVAEIASLKETVDPEFSEAKLNNEVSALTLTLQKLEKTVQDPTPSRIEMLKDEAENKVTALRSATPDTWLALREDAYETVQDYASAVGQTRDDAAQR